MRLYCLASISAIPPPTDYIPPLPYNEGADELILYSEYDGPIVGFHNLPSDYRLTEICIGWKTFQDGPKKLYEIQIYQKNSRFLNFAMLRGLATITHMDKQNFCFDLCLAVSKECSFRYAHDIDLKIRAFCIRNTTTRGIVTPEEEFAYNNFAKQINDFWKENPHITADNLRMEILQKFDPFVLPNPSTEKVLKQKLTDFQTAINLLCNPETGSYKNITPTVYNARTKTSKPSRIYQQVECLLYLKETLWHSKKPRILLHADMEKFRDCISLQWNNVTLNNKIDFSAFNFQNLKSIEFKNVDLGKEMKFWYQLAPKINFATVYTLYLQNCGIQKLEDKFFETLSNVSVLRLNDNNITFISTSISKLKDLYELNLDNNKNLTDDGIPWNDIPTNIVYLNLVNTNIITIPSEVKNFKRLDNLMVKSPKLQHINWSAFHRNSMKLHFTGGGAEIDSVQLKDINTDDLKISNLKFKKFDSSGMRFSDLSFINNKLENFNLADINYDNLRFLTITKNSLKSFSWRNIPRQIRSLRLSHNEIETISSDEDAEIDFSVFTSLAYIHFNGNAIKALPKGFENIPDLETLNLEDNCFGKDGADDLTEALWHRLPKSLKRLYLSKNKIHSVSCYLKKFYLWNLNVAECNLHYICPYLHTRIQKTAERGTMFIFLHGHMNVDARRNPMFELSFIPSNIYQLPKTDVQPTTGKAHTPFGTPNHANFPTTTLFADEKILRDTSRTKYNNKAVYEFKTDGVENVYACKCCAMCGESTDEPLFKQQMAPDSVLLIKEQVGSNDIKYGDFHAPFQPSIYYEPGQWRAKITSRLCVDCKKILKEKIDAAFEEFEKGDENLVEKKRTKNVKIYEVIESSQPQQQTLYPTAAVLEPSMTENTVAYPSHDNPSIADPTPLINRLPPIDTLLYNYPQEFSSVPAGPNPIYCAHDTPLNSNMEYQIDPIIGMENISINNDFVPAVDNNVQPVSILLDEYGNQVAVWNSFNSAVTPFQIPYPDHSTSCFTNLNFEVPLSENFVIPDSTDDRPGDETFYCQHFQEL